MQAQIAAREGLDVADLAVYCSGRPLDNEQVLSACAANLQTLEVDVRMLGGKVHGSLARAGKVKGQTPKVCATTLFITSFAKEVMLVCLFVCGQHNSKSSEWIGMKFYGVVLGSAAKN